MVSRTSLNRIMDYYGSLACIQKLPKSQRAEEEVYVFAFVEIIISFFKKIARTEWSYKYSSSAIKTYEFLLFCQRNSHNEDSRVACLIQ